MLLATLLLGSLSPNILWISMDDVGNDALAVYGEGDPETQPRTPQLDLLATRAMRFTNCYSYPSCKPTRSTWMTGRYGYRTGFGVTKDSRSLILAQRELTIAEVLQQSGYTTAYTGKWGLGVISEDPRNDPFPDPLSHGFDFIAAHFGNLVDFFQENVWVGTSTSLEPMAPGYMTTRTAEDTIVAIKTLPEPWFVMANFHSAHEPVHAPPPHLHSVDDLSSDRQKFRAMVEAMDTEMGRVLEAVDDSNTYVFVVGDNGTKRNYASIDGTGWKGTLGEGGVNVPLLVSGPTVKAGTVSDALVSTVDFFSTARELGSSVRLPPDLVIDSVSFLPILEGRKDSVREFVLAERFGPGSGPPYDFVQRMARYGRFKVFRRIAMTDRDSFFDVTAQPGLDGPEIELTSASNAERAAYRKLRDYLDSLPAPSGVPEQVSPRDNPPRPGQRSRTWPASSPVTRR